MPELCEVIADRYTARGLPTSADQVLVTSGAVAGIGIVLRALVGHGDRVVVENPGYPNTIDAARRGGARLVPLGLDPDGWDVDEAARTVRSAAATAALLIPDFHNPTGALMADEDRATLARALRLAGTVPVIDETIAEVVLDDGPMPLPFAAHDSRAITVGSSSKSHWGGLRTGWVRAPRTALAGAGRVAGHQRPRRSGAGAAGAARADAGGSRPHPRASRGPARVARRRWCRPCGCACPSCASGCLEAGCSCGASSPRASTPVASRWRPRTRGCSLAAGPRFAVNGGLDRWVRLPYVLPPEEMTEAVERLGRAVDTVRGGGVGSLGGRRRAGSARAGRPLVA